MISTNPNNDNDHHQPTQRLPLAERQVSQMLGVIIRQESTLRSAATHLDPANFPEHLKAYGRLWGIILRFWQTYQTLPTGEHICGELDRMLSYKPDDISDVEVDQINDFIRNTYHQPAILLTDHNIRVTMHYLELFLEDCLVHKMRKDLQGTTAGPIDLLGTLGSYVQQSESAKTVSQTQSSDPFPEGWHEEGLGLEFVDLRMPFFKRAMGGGLARTEVMGLIGPIGSCKSTLAIQATVNVATGSLARAEGAWRNHGQIIPLDYSYLFIYEGSMREMQLRSLCYGAEISRQTLENWDLKNFSRGHNLKPYEQKRFAEQIRQGFAAMGEYDRMMFWSQRLNKNWRCLDMTGNDKQHPGRGGGLIDEIAAIVDADQRGLKEKGIDARVGLIAVDYVGAMVERHCAAHNKDVDRVKYSLLKGAPLEAKNNLANRFDTAVMLIHQLSGAANDYGPGRLPKGTDAAGCKSFKECLDWLFIVGNPTCQQQTVITCDKHRRETPPQKCIVRIDGEFGRVVDQHDDFVWSERLREILPREEEMMLTGATISSPKTRSRIDFSLDREIHGL